MSRTVVVLGYSTSGKSTIGKSVRKRWADGSNGLEYRDSDEEIGKQCGGNIYRCYLDRDYRAALAFIENQERVFLKTLIDSRPPCLVVAGPNLPLREPEWSAFLTKVKPIAYHFTITPELCYARLLGRQEKIATEHGEDKRCGSWNLGSLCDWDMVSKRYVPVEPQIAIARLQKLMQENVRRYNLALSGDRAYDARDMEKSSARMGVVRRIIVDLSTEE